MCMYVLYEHVYARTHMHAHTNASETRRPHAYYNTVARACAFQIVCARTHMAEAFSVAWARSVMDSFVQLQVVADPRQALREAPFPPPPVAPRPSWRYYCVWAPEEASGVYGGPHPRCWSHIEVVTGGRFPHSGARLRRFACWEGAVRAFPWDGPACTRGSRPRWHVVDNF